MKKLGAIALFAGAVLLSTHILAPAVPPASVARELAAGRDALAQAVAAADQVEQVNAEVERLRERLASQRTYSPPARDPSRFGGKSEPPRPQPVEAPTPAVVEAPKSVLPQLIAISTAADSGVSVRTAVLGIGDNVQLVKPGDTFAAFVVRSIGIDAVELVESATGRATTVSLR